MFYRCVHPNERTALKQERVDINVKDKVWWHWWHKKRAEMRMRAVKHVLHEQFQAANEKNIDNNSSSYTNTYNGL